jgi:hypothetical protein
LITKDHTNIFAKSGLNIDADSNDAVDIAYGGTNEITAAAAADMFGAAMTATGAAAILDIADSVTAGDSYSNFSTSADDDTVDELMAAIDTALGIRCLESVFGDALEADDLELSGTTLQLAAEIPHTDAEQTWTANQTLAAEKYTILTSVPGSPVTGVRYCFDNDTANPCDIDGDDDYCAYYDGADWVADEKTDGTKFFSSIPTPTLIASELNDTSDPHTLIVEELKGMILSNSASTGADQWEFPAVTEGWNFIFIIEAAQNVALHPIDSSKWYLNGTVLAADRSIVNTAPTIGESIACFSTGTYVYCESKYSDFVSAAE